MKFFSLFLLLFPALLASSLHAQMTDGKARFGFRLGLTGSNLYDDARAQNRDGRLGLIGGAFFKIPLGGSNFSLRPEVLYATKGASFKRDSFISSLKSAYLEVPISLEYNLSVLNLHAGIHASLLANANGEFKDAKGQPINFDREDLENLDLGWHVGAGLDLGNIGAHLRINRGLKNIGDQTLKDIVGSLKNAAWSLTLVYGF
ncbi:MAG: PorT family protein [Saprospiraceae bacterium]|nr:PorT family protein [Saprospiraceae bacterium]MDW8484808.1 porin family protein [Saprospiraceae bacterium]